MTSSLQTMAQNKTPKLAPPPPPPYVTPNPKASTAALASPKIFGIFFVPTYNIQAEKQKDNTQFEYYYYELRPVVKLGDYKVTGTFYYYDDKHQPKNSEWQDSYISLNRKPWVLGDYFYLTPGSSAGLPLSKDSYENAGIKTTLGVSLKLDLNTKNIGLTSTQLYYSLGYTKYFTKSDTKKSGSAAPSYRVRQRLNYIYSFTDSFGFLFRFQFDSNYASNNDLKNSFWHFQELDYSLSPNFTLMLGHQNANSLYNSETAENNLKLFDKYTSEYYTGFTIEY